VVGIISMESIVCWGRKLSFGESMQKVYLDVVLV
jgi:hypothetical protein